MFCTLFNPTELILNTIGLTTGKTLNQNTQPKHSTKTLNQNTQPEHSTNEVTHWAFLDNGHRVYFSDAFDIPD